MNILNFFLIFILTIFLISCAEKQEKVSIIKEDNLEMQMIDAYNEGLEEFNRGDIFFAVKKFNEVELLYPQSIWAPRSNLMAAYAYYSQLYFNEAIFELERNFKINENIIRSKVFLFSKNQDQIRNIAQKSNKFSTCSGTREFLSLLPKLNEPNTDYAYYLIAICHYNQIVDEKKDLGEIMKSKTYFNLLIKDFPDTEFAEDARFKLELIEEILASKELYLANYYRDREKWIPAINRYKKIINKYDTTIFVEEALYRLVELNYKLGLIDEAKKYTALLGYNYQSSEWYEKSYKIMNKNYKKKITTKDIKKEESLIKKFKDLLK